MEDEDFMPVDPPISERVPLPQGTTYINNTDGFEYTLMWEADGCFNTECHGQLYKILMDHEGDLFIADADEFQINFSLVPLDEHPQTSLF